MMKSNKLQTTTFYILTVLSVIAFIVALLFATPFYDTVLWGNNELISYFETELQVFNKYTFIVSLVGMLFVVYLIIIKFKKYNIELYHLIFIAIVSVLMITLNIIVLLRYQPIKQFYSTFDYSIITKLQDYKFSKSWDIITVTNHLCIVVSYLLMIISSAISYYKYLINCEVSK